MTTTQQIGFLHLQQPLGRRQSIQRSSQTDLTGGLSQALVSLQGMDVDVAKSSGQRLRRRMSGTIFPKRFTRYYFELQGHILRWFENDVGEDMLSQRSSKAVEEPVGLLSLLSFHVVDLLGPIGPDGSGSPPSGTYGGFCLRDLATGSGCRGNIYLYAEGQSELDAWVSALRRAFDYFCQAPLANIGPKQAASEKPILEGTLYVRDTLEGIPLNTWAHILVSLFDTRIECRSLSNNTILSSLLGGGGGGSGASPGSPATTNSNINSTTNNNNNTNSPSMAMPSISLINSSNTLPCRIDRLTKDFYVGDSRVREHAFLISDFTWTIYFAAKDSIEKLFWMQSIAKVLLNLAAMTEHANRIMLAQRDLDSENKHKKKTNHDSDDSDGEDEDALDRKRPPQVRHNSIKRFYGLGLSPDEDDEDNNKNGGKQVTMSPIVTTSKIKSPVKTTTTTTTTTALAVSLDDDDDSSNNEVEKRRENTRKSIAKLKDPIPVVVTTTTTSPLQSTTSSSVLVDHNSNVKKTATTTTTTPPATTTTTTSPNKNTNHTKDKPTATTTTNTTANNNNNTSKNNNKSGGNGALVISLGTDELPSSTTSTSVKKPTTTTTSTPSSAPPVWLESALSWIRGAAKNSPTGPMTSDGFFPTTVSRLVAQWKNPQDSDVVCGILMRAKEYGLARFEGNYVSVEEEKMIFIRAPVNST
jgi:hypothetical protein